MKLNKWFKAWSRRVGGTVVAALFAGAMALFAVPAIHTGNTLPRELPREHRLPWDDNPGSKIRRARGSQRRTWQPVRLNVKKQGGHGYQR